jgi:tetratricopeptide (TPR) repeat protein
MLAPICDAYGKRSVRCVAVVSDYYNKTAIKTAIKAAHWSDKRTYIDEEDRYSAQLGVILYPSIGIADGSRKLQAYEPFVKVNYAQRIEATIRFLLGDINKKQFQNALAPPLQEQETQDRDTALLNYNFARKLFELGESETAVARAERAIELNPDLADAYALIGMIRVKQHRCEDAVSQFQKALRLDKKNKQATKGMARCK